MVACETIRNKLKTPSFANKSVGCDCTVHFVLNNPLFSIEKHILFVNDTWEKQTGLVITLWVKKNSTGCSYKNL